VTAAAGPQPGSRAARAVLLTGVALGTALVVLMYWDGARPHLPGMRGILGVLVGGVVAWLLVVGAATLCAELLRRHHRALGSAAARTGRRAAVGAGRSARKHGSSLVARLAAWAGPRWQARQARQAAVTGGGTADATATPATADATVTGAAPRPGEPVGDSVSHPDVPCGNCGRPFGEHVLVEDPRAPDGRGFACPRAAVCRVCLRPGSAADPLEPAGIGVAHRSHIERGEAIMQAARDRSDAAPDPAAAPAAAATAQNGDHTMTTQQTEPGSTPLPSANAPAGWKALAAATADFEPGDDGELLDWMASEVAGMSAYSEALIEVYEACVNSVGLDPVAMSAMHDTADAGADAATAMAYARQKFAGHYAEVREFVANGGVMPYDGRWIKGEGDT